MVKKCLISYLIILLAIPLFGQDIIEKVSTKTWLLKSDFPQEGLVFVKTDSGLIKVIHQVYGSGLPVIISEVCDISLRNDTLFLKNGMIHSKDETFKDYYFTYNDSIGLMRKGNPLGVLFDEPIIYVCNENGNLLNFRITITDQTKFSFEKNEVYINEKILKITQNK